MTKFHHRQLLMIFRMHNLNEAIRTGLEALKIVLFFVVSFRHTLYCQKLPPRKDTDFQSLEVQRIFELANFRQNEAKAQGILNIFPSILTKLYLKFSIPKPVRTTPFRLPHRNFADENKKIPSSCNPEDEIYLVVPPRFALASRQKPYQVHRNTLVL